MTEIPVRVLTAANPSALTGPGTNSFLIGREAVAVVDPGPDLPGHVDAILAAAGPGRITHILVTHPHLDHSGAVPRLAAATGAPVMAFGAPDAGRSPVMDRLAALGQLAPSEGVDHGFRPDVVLPDGAVIETDEWRIEALHTPGHMGCHLSFALGDRILCGDVVMDWTTTLISPPDGDVADYLRALDRLAARGARTLLPAHGGPVRDPAARLAELAAHRRARTAQILTALEAGPGRASDLAARVYDIAPALLPAATRNVLAHLVALADLGAVAADPRIAADAIWRRA
ncbi:MBL fold metallo-hydrolase [Paracoccus luteus]|uniref:MBL fold metallo-hydrolase n=1 Tax=Paracoccus luteus TaxID=2508543 RepID=UPI0010705845|nr:MBL fold metallo-hydrolase [Paracoccus luteus]